jgi:hypothetical protein
MHCLSFQQVVWRYPRKSESNFQVAIPEAQTSTTREDMRYTSTLLIYAFAKD